MSVFLQTGHQGVAIMINVVGDETPETLRYLSRFAAFQAETMVYAESAGEVEYRSWLSACTEELK